MRFSALNCLALAFFVQLLAGCSNRMDTVKARYMGPDPRVGPVVSTGARLSPQANDWLEEALALYEDGKFDSCYQVLEKQISHDPSSWQAYYLKGRIETYKDEFEKSLRSLRLALQFCPDDTRSRAMVYLALAQCHEKSGDTARAQQNFVTALNLDPESEQARRGVERLKPMTSIERK